MPTASKPARSASTAWRRLSEEGNCSELAFIQIWVMERRGTRPGRPDRAGSRFDITIDILISP